MTQLRPAQKDAALRAHARPRKLTFPFEIHQTILCVRISENAALGAASTTLTSYRASFNATLQQLVELSSTSGDLQQFGALFVPFVGALESHRYQLRSCARARTHTPAGSSHAKLNAAESSKTSPTALHNAPSISNLSAFASLNPLIAISDFFVAYATASTVCRPLRTHAISTLLTAKRRTRSRPRCRQQVRTKFECARAKESHDAASTKLTHKHRAHNNLSTSARELTLPGASLCHLSKARHICRARI
jgi:hypothetical protein